MGKKGSGGEESFLGKITIPALVAHIARPRHKAGVAEGGAAVTVTLTLSSDMKDKVNLWSYRRPGRKS